jgi:hypothetical protein
MAVRGRKNDEQATGVPPYLGRVQPLEKLRLGIAED